MPTPKRLTTIPADEAKPISYHDEQPTLKALQSAVGGPIEAIPHWNKYENQPCEAYCDEEGMITNEPLNKRATKLWLEILGDGPFLYAPLYGDIVIVQAIPNAKQV